MMDPLCEEAQIFVRPFESLFRIHDAPTVIKRNEVSDESVNTKMICTYTSFAMEKKYTFLEFEIRVQTRTRARLKFEIRVQTRTRAR